MNNISWAKAEDGSLITCEPENVNVIWLERNVWRGNDKGIHQCQQFVIRSTSGRLARPRTTRTQSVTVIRWNKRPLLLISTTVMVWGNSSVEAAPRVLLGAFWNVPPSVEPLYTR